MEKSITDNMACLDLNEGICSSPLRMIVQLRHRGFSLKCGCISGKRIIRYSEDDRVVITGCIDQEIKISTWSCNLWLPLCHVTCNGRDLILRDRILFLSPQISDLQDILGGLTSMRDTIRVAYPSPVYKLIGLFYPAYSLIVSQKHVPHAIQTEEYTSSGTRIGWLTNYMLRYVSMSLLIFDISGVLAVTDSHAIRPWVGRWLQQWCRPHWVVIVYTSSSIERPLTLPPEVLFLNRTSCYPRGPHFETFKGKGWLVPELFSCIHIYDDTHDKWPISAHNVTVHVVASPISDKESKKSMELGIQDFIDSPAPV